MADKAQLGSVQMEGPEQAPTPAQVYNIHENEKVVILKINPEYEKIWGQLPEKEYRALKESIRIDGLLEKLKVNANLEILDGHNRYRAIRELGIPITDNLIEIVDTDQLVRGPP